jgi:hypothetical protein
MGDLGEFSEVHEASDSTQPKESDLQSNALALQPTSAVGKPIRGEICTGMQGKLGCIEFLEKKLAVVATAITMSQ